MYKHRATMTERRRQILKLVAKGYSNKQIARKLEMTLSNTAFEKWRLYCFLGDIHTAVDAIYMGLQMGYLQELELSEAMREEIYESENEKQMYGSTPARRRDNRNIQTNAEIILFPAKRTRTAQSVV